MQDSKRDTDVKNRLLDSMGEGKSGMIWENTIEASMLPHVKEMTVQVQCMKQGTQGWYAGTAQGDGMGRWVGRGFGTGDTCTPMADSCHCMAKTTAIL